MHAHQEQVKLMDKIVFVLTKVDLLTDPHHYAPWTLTRLANNQGIFETHIHMEALIKRKEVYFRNVFLQSFHHLIRCQTYHRGRFPMHLPGFQREEDVIYYNDFLTEKQRDAWIE